MSSKHCPSTFLLQMWIRNEWFSVCFWNAHKFNWYFLKWRISWSQIVNRGIKVCRSQKIKLFLKQNPRLTGSAQEFFDEFKRALFVFHFVHAVCVLCFIYIFFKYFFDFVKRSSATSSKTLSGNDRCITSIVACYHHSIITLSRGWR